MIYVVGSGPAGVACAVALLNKGLEVTMLDAGIELEPDQRARVDALAQRRPEEWKDADLDFLKVLVRPGPGGLNRKTAYGSDYTYQGTEPVRLHDVKMHASFARGGLSTVWGAAVLPFEAADIADWPVSLAELAPHYQAILRWMPYSAQHDDLESILPLYADRFDQLQTNRQVTGFLKTLRLHRDPLRQEGVWFGRSRLAVVGRPDEADDPDKASSGCVYCAQCMYGCPYGYIYNTEQTLKDLASQPRFHYVKDRVVKRLEETPGGVQIELRDRRKGHLLQATGTKVFLAAGVLSTTRILLASLNIYDQPIPMVTSQHFLFPWLRGESTPGVTRERLHTLAQAFVEIHDATLTPEWIHLQVYGYTDFYQAVLSRLSLGLLKWSRLSEPLLGRLLMVQGYLHSRHSARMSVELKKDRSGGEAILTVRSQRSPKTTEIIRRLLSKLSALRRWTGAMPVRPGLSISLPGDGSHNGGTFPMQRTPGPFQSDVLGRPHGFKNVHAVDATVFPSIPATTITLSVMANAHRIGATCDVA